MRIFKRSLGLPYGEEMFRGQEGKPRERGGAAMPTWSRPRIWSEEPRFRADLSELEPEHYCCCGNAGQFRRPDEMLL